jgi:hypothetical protein
MRQLRMRLIGALGVMLGAAVPTALDAQTPMPWQTRQPAVEGYYTRLRLDADGGPATADGIGGRLMWSATRPEDAGTSWLADHAAIGLLASHTPAQSRGFSTLHLGAVVDVQPFLTPIAGRVTPYLSIGAGALRTTLSSDAAASTRPRSPLTDRDNTTATLSPGVGARVQITPGIALQGDLRDVMTFRHDTRHNVAFGAGLRFTR